MARFYAPTTVFIDEIDAVASSRSGGDENGRKMKAELLVQIDGANSVPEEKDGKLKLVTVVAATNNPWDLDDAIIRRLEKRIYIPLPSEVGRQKLFEIKCAQLTIADDINYEKLVN